MDFLSGEINKLKRKAPEDANSRYIKRGDLEAKRQQEYIEQQKKLQVERELREAEKLQRLEEHESKKRFKEIVRAAKPSSDADVDLTTTQQELEALHEPIQLFGEEPEEVRNRLRQIKAKRESMASSTSSILAEVYSAPLDVELPQDSDVEICRAWAKSEEAKKLQNNLFLLLRVYIRDWGRTEDAEPEAQSLYPSAREHLARLLLRLKAGNLPPDILVNLSNLANGLKTKDYTAANHAYLQMSIGKAAWPVGVTMVGIHERAQRERVKQVTDGAYILADEITRQWLQSLKRLITHREKHCMAE